MDTLTQDAVEAVLSYDFAENELSPAGFVADNFCLICGRYGAERHHVFCGTANRAVSDFYGLVVPLCRDHHREAHDHPNKGLDILLKQSAQGYFEKHYGTREQFIKSFGRSWL